MLQNVFKDILVLVILIIKFDYKNAFIKNNKIYYNNNSI